MTTIQAKTSQATTSQAATRTISPGPGLRRVRDGYWRVTAASGAVLGYVEEVTDEGRLRFRAKRLHSGLRILAIGEFAALDEATESLR
ncbi:MAG: hypothetical protein EPO52_12990 [Herbiconiux sp.]|uniref:hypothetical protein n=1 Tax=Herbiconiux sp. TaxID=1871186 RepID=UPI0011FE7BB8|nr:hypothetical protein [Herbiconiux sp.]TAJ47193.1 MAG: hypothetical protein EPO52_12990 [Herbiconiux sp.]